MRSGLQYRTRRPGRDGGQTVVLRKVSIRRPRVRSGRQEVPLPTFQTMAQTDPLRRRTVEQLLVGVSTRGYARSLEPLPADIPSRSVSKSAVSRRFVAKASQLAAWQATPLDDGSGRSPLVHISIVEPHALLCSHGSRSPTSRVVACAPRSILCSMGRGARGQTGPATSSTKRPGAAPIATSRPRRGCCDTSPAVSTRSIPARPGARRARGDGDAEWPLAASPALAGHDQRRREPHQQAATAEALARRPMLRWVAAGGSGQGVPAPEGTC